MDDERYISVEQSIIDACREVREMIAGRIPELEWRDVFYKLKNELSEEETEPEVSKKIGNYFLLL